MERSSFGGILFFIFFSLPLKYVIFHINASLFLFHLISYFVAEIPLFFFKGDKE